MCDNPSDVVHQPIFNRVWPLLDPNAELLSETTASAQYLQVNQLYSFQSALMHASQNLYASSNYFYTRLVHDLPDSLTNIGGVPDNRRIQIVTAPRSVSAMGQFPFREFSAPNELTVSYRSDMYMDGLVTGHYPTFMAPTMPQIKLLGTEVSHNKTSLVDYSLPSFSRPCVINRREFPRTQAPAQFHQEGSVLLWEALQNLRRK